MPMITLEPKERGYLIRSDRAMLLHSYQARSIALTHLNIPSIGPKPSKATSQKQEGEHIEALIKGSS